MDLSIVIVNWNSAEFLCKCLASIFERTAGFLFEVIVVDNASYDRAGEMIGRDFPQVRFLQSEANLGFARANQLGYEQSTGRSLLFLNPDTEILGSAISDLLTCLGSLPDCGAISCRLLNGDGTLQTTCIQAFPTLVNQCIDFEALRSRIPSRIWGNEALFSKSRTPSPVEMVCGAALMIRRDVFEEVGGFSADYFMYGEDADLCRKVWKVGRKVYYLPSADIIHHGGQSTKANVESSVSILQMQQSLATYFSKSHGKGSAAMFRATRIGVALTRLVLLTMLLAIPANRKARASRHGAFRKWCTILRWSLGLSEW